MPLLAATPSDVVVEKAGMRPGPASSTPIRDRSLRRRVRLLDDNIHVVKNGNRVMGAEKKRYLAWRGYPNAGGAFVDDYGAPTNTAGKDGDIRPLPVLLPIL